MDPDIIENITGLVAVLLGTAIVLIPVLALSARFALKPVIEAIIRLRQSQGAAQDSAVQDRRISLLEAEVQNLQQAIHSLTEAEDFRRRLGSSTGAASDEPSTVRLPDPARAGE